MLGAQRTYLEIQLWLELYKLMGSEQLRQTSVKRPKPVHASFTGEALPKVKYCPEADGVGL